jgi:predicted ATPase/signal transduction histidine kinase
VLAGYDIIEQLYQSDRTQVYRVRRHDDGQSVVLKLLSSKFPSFRELLQFRQQYTLAHNLKAPGLLQIYRLETYRNGYALVMEDFSGSSLAAYLVNHRASGFAIAEFLAIAIQIARAIEVLHTARIVHKDIKPANMLIQPDTQQIKLIDLSIASQLPQETQILVNPNQLEGTLAYLAPEQTGRMNRGIDYRCDFYALGITFYELLTGVLPFPTQEPSELIYCHLAQKPPRLTEVKASIPQVIAQIVHKLMAKNAEDRYQTIAGLIYDLEKCQQSITITTEIPEFPIATQDYTDRFTIAEKLYGRETEVANLLTAFERVAQGNTEVIMVAGFSGIGKTAVVNEVHKPIARQRGYFIKGKFDQFQRNVPLSAVIQALRDLVRQLMGESPSQIARWRKQLLQALGDQGRVLTDVIPGLIDIIGDQPVVHELTGSAAQQRFHRLMQQFVQVFATIAHPLVIFLDDLQWADSASLKLLQELATATEQQALLIIGAYRDNEVSIAHPLMSTLSEIGKIGTTIATLRLKPLSLNSLNQLIADTFGTPAKQTQSLSELIDQKTQGNPFFSIQFLRSLHDDRYIRFNHRDHCWECDVTQVQSLTLSDDVIALMTSQLQKLTPSVQIALQRAACIGHQFDLATLAIVCETTPQTIAQDLWAALQAGFIAPTNEVYKFFQADTAALPLQPPSTPNATYKFLHDRIQQAAYQLIPTSQTQITHLSIGRQLLQNIATEQRDDRVFEIINQFNRALDLIDNPAEQAQIRQLNWQAGNKAKAATAYPAAQQYFQTAIALVTPNTWQESLEPTLALHHDAAEIAYLNDDEAQMQVWIDAALAYVSSDLDRVHFAEIMIYAKIAQGQPLAAIELGLSSLARLNIHLPLEPTSESIQTAYQSIWTALQTRTIANLVDLPRMADARILAAMRILHALAPALVLAAKPQLFLLNTITEVQLSLQYGNTAISAAGYAHFSAALCGLFNQIDQGREFGELALHVSQRIPDASIRSRVLLIVGGITIVWTSPLRSGIPLLQTGYEQGIASGTLEIAAFNRWYESQASYFMGEHLDDLAGKLVIHSEQIAQLHQPMLLKHNQLLTQVVQELVEPATNHQLGQHLQAETFGQDYQAANNTLGLYYLHLHQLMLHTLFGNYVTAQTQAIVARNYVKGAIGQASVPYLYWYDSLALLGTLNTTESPEWQRIQANQAQLHQWTEFAPSNFQHKFDLVAAECQRVQQNYPAAMELYERAISAAQTQGYVQEEALANELAAKFYQVWGKPKIAAVYMQEAYYCYARWGAQAKVQSLAINHAELLAPICQTSPATLSVMETIAAIAAPMTIQSTHNEVGQGHNLNERIDFAALLQVSQALTSTIELEHLLQTLTQKLLENSGADHCLLLLQQETDWQIRVQADLSQTILLNQPLTNNPSIPQKLLQYVINSLNTVVIDRLDIDLPVIDTYLQNHQPQSALCLPILNQGSLIGVMYLANHSASGIFTADRLQVVNFLASQAAISLANAHLYQQVQQTLKDLQQAQLQIVQSEKMSMLGGLIAGVAHEINNPIGCIVGNLGLAEGYIDALISLINLYAQKLPQPDREITQHIERIDLEYLRHDLPKLINTVQAAGERITEISQSLRDFSRADTDHKKSCNLHSGIDSTIMILHHRLKANQHRPAIQIVKDYGNLPEIKCFPGQLNQVLMNILANAIDALEESNQGKTFSDIQAKPNQITIRTSIKHNQVIIIIADNGSGMPESVKTRIFDHLFTTKAVGKGTGLGLAIAQQIIVEKHGGKLSVQSQLGQGTEFILCIPME